MKYMFSEGPKSNSIKNISHTLDKLMHFMLRDIKINYYSFAIAIHTAI